METLKLLQELYSTLSSTEIFLLLALLISAFPMIFKLLAKIIQNRKAINAIIGNDNDDILKIQETILTLATKEDIEKLKEQLQNIQSKINEDSLLIGDVKREVSLLSGLLQKELQNILEKMSDDGADLRDQHQSIKDVLSKVNESIAKTISQLDKIDEFTRASIPEFRSYHKEISKDLSDLSRDIALVERSLQNQINNTNAVKLR